MITLSRYITEKKTKSWMDCVRQMYAWYCDNFGAFYDVNHQYDGEHYKYCDLIDHDVVADCSGFVGACLCLYGCLKNPLKMNVRLGSFNHYKNSNVEDVDTSNFDKDYKDELSYMNDIDAFRCVKLKDTDDLSEIKTGDILVKGSHVTIAADDGARHLYDWGRRVIKRSVNELESHEPVKFYVPEDKTMTYPFRSYWRLK